MLEISLVFFFFTEKEIRVPEQLEPIKNSLKQILEILKDRPIDFKGIRKYFEITEFSIKG